MKKYFLYYSGTLLICLSLLLFIFVGIPIVSSQLHPSPIIDMRDREFALWIPKIKAGGRIIPDISPWNNEEYKKALQRGIAHGKGFAKPGQKGVIYLFAHSSGLPWELMYYNTVFLRLGELEKDDIFTLWYEKVAYQYKVTKKAVVNPTDTSAIAKENKDEVIIQTCTPIGTDWQRLLIYADEVK